MESAKPFSSTKSSADPKIGGRIELGQSEPAITLNSLTDIRYLEVYMLCE